MRTNLLKKFEPYAFIPLRLALGIIFFAHGAQKLFGWFHGTGLTATIANFKSYLGLPAFLTVIAVFTEFFGSIFITIGLMTRLCALGLGFVMTVAIFKVHLANGFFLNWFGTPAKGHGIEYNLALLAICLTLFLGGAGKFSLDEFTAKRKKNNSTVPHSAFMAKFWILSRGEAKFFEHICNICKKNLAKPQAKSQNCSRNGYVAQ
ncbi:MAG: DoxX family protein [Elusimicrobia bacterium]|nr:DoxX family protein [Elusimicrobiota bacterium]